MADDGLPPYEDIMKNGNSMFAIEKATKLTAIRQGMRNKYTIHKLADKTILSFLESDRLKIEIVDSEDWGIDTVESEHLSYLKHKYDKYERALEKETEPRRNKHIVKKKLEYKKLIDGCTGTNHICVPRSAINRWVTDEILIKYPDLLSQLADLEMKVYTCGVCNQPTNHRRQCDTCMNDRKTLERELLDDLIGISDVDDPSD